MNPLLQGHSGTTPEASRNVFSINQGTNEDDSQSNPHPEAGLLTSVREDRHDMATGVQRESAVGQDNFIRWSFSRKKFQLAEKLSANWNFLPKIRNLVSSKNRKNYCKIGVLQFTADPASSFQG